MSSTSTLSDQASLELARLWKTREPAIRRAEANLSDEMEEYWGPALRILETLLHLYVDISEMLSRQCHNEKGRWAIDVGSDVPPPGGWVTQALHVTNMRTIRTSLSALCLARAGMCDDAYALCRVLYEIYLVREYIVRDDDALVAQRYFDHVQATDERTQKFLGNRLSDDDRNSIRNEARDPESRINIIKKKYGGEWKYFCTDYGWAFPGKKDRAGEQVSRPSLERIAAFVMADRRHHHVYVKSSQQLHSGVVGVLGFGQWDVVPMAPSLRGIGTVLHYMGPWIRDAGFSSLLAIARAREESGDGMLDVDQACVDLLVKLSDELDDAVAACRGRVQERKGGTGKRERDNLYESLREELARCVSRPEPTE